MRIGIDSRLWNQTGVGRYIQELVKNLVEVDKENKYTLFLQKNELVGPLLPTTYYLLRYTDIRWHSLKEQLLMPFILWREHLDLVHFPYFSVPIFYPGKFVVTIHDLILDHFKTGEASTLPWPIYKIKRLGYKLVMWMTLHRAVKIITVSQATKKEIIDHYKIRPEKIVVTYEAAGLYSSSEGALATESRSSSRLTSFARTINEQYFLYVGNAYPHKNLERLLEAIASIKYKVLSIKLILVGPEDYFYTRLKEKVGQMGLADQIIFHGPATKEELQNLYKNAVALVFPSLMEGFGLPGLEAMASGCPVICSDIPVFREIYGEAAVYFDPDNINDLSSKLEAIYFDDSNHQSKIIKKGFKQVEKYSWGKLAEETLEIYKNT